MPRTEALASDYDGTLAEHGAAPPEVIAALERWRASGRRVVLVTGRRLPQLVRVFDRLDLCDLVVAENGALLVDPASGRSELLCAPPPPALAAGLAARGVEPVVTGRVIVATTRAHEAVVREVVAAVGAAVEPSYNKSSLMLLPPGVDKASGLRAALTRLGIPAARVLGAGDAENDVPFLRACGASLAVANALPLVKRRATLVATLPHGLGVAEVLAAIMTREG